MTDLILRRPEERDIPDLLALMRRPAVQWGTGRLPFQSDDYITSRVRNPAEGTYSIAAERDGVAIGLVTIVRGRDRRAHTGALAITVHDAHHRQGVGRRLMEASLDLADNWPGLIRLELTVNADNVGAIALYRTFGFEDEGVSRADLLRGGVYVDTLRMGRLVAPPSHGQARSGVLR
ncbi:GNAT family N-acetyltransferase [Tropicibacter sp. S64]|uniref:GNAT family N-acetyltransferase n=1 Tax=Tropicibacter sp. S64 TaxID=3415122 RepID=UPI003C7A4B67